MNVRTIRRKKMKRDIVKSYDKNFYKIMAENFGDEIFVTDGGGSSYL